jgi:predicted MFS family arabinose efflux permease
MGGMLCGVLLARTISGVVGQSLGWRAMYGIAAIATLGVLVVLRAILPESRPAAGLSYPALALGIYVLGVPTRHRLDATEAVGRGVAGE